MVLEALCCKHRGQSQHLKRDGTTPAGTQPYRCFDCGRTARRPGRSQTYSHKAPDPLGKEQITQMVLNKAAIRDTARSLGVNRNTLSAPFKKNGAARAVVQWFMLTLSTSIEA